MTLPRDYASFEEIKVALLELSEEVARRARFKHYLGQTVSVGVRGADFSHPTGFHRQMKLHSPTQYGSDIAGDDSAMPAALGWPAHSQCRHYPLTAAAWQPLSADFIWSSFEERSTQQSIWWNPSEIWTCGIIACFVTDKRRAGISPRRKNWRALQITEANKHESQ